MLLAERRSALPWEVHEITESFCIRDANGQVLAYVYYEHETGRGAAKGDGTAGDN